MSSKKYLSLEEAATQLRIKSEELIRLREKGDIRGFADRGTWKFKSEDVEELGRRRQPDSNPEVPLIEEDDELGRQPTIITKGRGGSTSDSDVRLVPDDTRKSKLAGSSAELPVMKDSDSDVRLAEEGKAKPPASDSDVQLVTSKSEDSDSDVQLSDSDSDVRLSNSDSDVRLAPVTPSDSDVKLVSRSGTKLKRSDSDVTLAPKGKKPGKGMFDDVPLTGSESVLLEDSGMALAGDSGISLEGASSLPLSTGSSGHLLGSGELPASEAAENVFEDDDGISLDVDSGIQLAADSGISLGADSGIRLGADSGIRLSDEPRSGKRAQTPADDLDSGVPLLLSKDKDTGRTDVEVPMLSDDSEELETLQLSSSPKPKGDTSVEFFDDEEASSDDIDVAEADEDDLEVADDILGEDDEIEQLEVFDTDDSLFDESFVEGGSAVGIPAMGSRIALPHQSEWSPGDVVLTGVSAVFLACGAMVGMDLLRLIWAGNNAGMYEGGLVSMMAGFFQ